jgi:hypothetical protein
MIVLLLLYLYILNLIVINTNYYSFLLIKL